MIDAEEWRPVVGLEGLYEVSDLGRVRSLDRVIEQPSIWRGQFNGMVRRRLAGRMMPLHNDGKYLYVVFGQRRKARVHTVVAEAFLGPRPPGLHVLHWNDDRTNCSVANLRYGTSKENHDDRRRNGHSFEGERNGFAKLSAVDVASVLALRGTMPRATIAAAAGCHPAYISIIGRRSWRSATPASADDARAWFEARSASVNEARAAT